jgi:hypothetical protein
LALSDRGRSLAEMRNLTIPRGDARSRKTDAFSLATDGGDEPKVRLASSVKQAAELARAGTRQAVFVRSVVSVECLR